MGILAISGNIISTLTAYFSGYERDDIKNGLYGFNGTLVGIAAGVFLQMTVGAWIMMAIASCLSTWIARLFSMQRLLPGFTAPFIIAVWILLGFCKLFMPDALLVSESAASALKHIDYLQAFGQGIGQVMFQGSLWAGLLFLAGIFVHSRTAAFYTILGVLLPLPFALMLGIDADVLSMGLMGYNGVLCAIALGNRSWASGMWALLSVLLSVILQIAGMNWGIVTLTAPFVLSVWITMGIQKMASFNK